MRHLAMAMALLAAPLTVSADPMGSVQGPGNVRLDSEHPQISLDREALTYDVGPDTVRITADLEFSNHGEASDVEMSFPMLLWHPGRGQDLIRSFGVSLGDRPLTSTKDETDRKLVLQGHERHCTWYRFTAPFEANASVRLTCWYLQSSLDPMQVPYILATGGTWKGPIQDFTLRVNLGERLNFSGIALTGDDEPLPYEEADSTLTWRCEDYSGTPELLWLRADRGPASLTVDGAAPAWDRTTLTGEPRIQPHDRALSWHEGRLLVRESLLRDLTLARSSADGDGAVFPRGDVSVETFSASLPVSTDQDGNIHEATFVDPAPVCEAFGGSVEHSFTPEGDLTVAVTSAPDNLDDATAIALDPNTNFAHRLRCLRRLADRWPERSPEVAQAICERDAESFHVQLFLLGRLADDPPEYATTEAVLPRLTVPGDKGWLVNILRGTLHVCDDDVVRGLGLVLAARDPAEAREHIISLADAGERWQPVVARNIGFALRAVKAPDTAERLIAIIDRPEEPRNVNSVIQVLGYLGDEAALPFLAEVASGKPEWKNHLRQSAARAIGRIGTPEAREILASLKE